VRTPLRDLTGMTFDRWTVLRRASNVGEKVRWFCRCVCGKERIVYKENLLRGLSRSCGCLNREALLKAVLTHGHRRGGQRTYYTGCYTNILGRCTRPHHPNWKDYGARGIAIYSGWLGENGFLEFVKYIQDHLGPRPGLSHSLDRKDNDGNYEPGNLRWATPEMQTRNSRPKKNPEGSASGRSGGRQQT
jgi:hypothetical protein